ncbi:MAG TPA: amidase [Thermoanaerobaculia bacterium]|nr:amidase [Thermoanaerobaculia bacterium]
MTDSLDRRRFIALLSAAAAAPAAFAQEEKKGAITPEILADAEKVFGLELTGPERDLMLNGLDEQLGDYKAIREVRIDNSVPPAVKFDPVLPGMKLEGESSFQLSTASNIPSAPEELPFLTVVQLGRLLRSGKATSVGLTKMYLDRLRKLDPVLHAVITYTEERALEAAERADRELASGKDRGPLHGIPWGAKDLLAVKGYRTTWGSVPFKEQRIEEDATVVERLDAAGAVLVAKLTLGELAWGDVWFGGMTRNPWNPEQGSSGSSAGSASTAAAGAVGFTIGSETLGSIVSPCTRTGSTGLRPTFGRVSRHGAMALSWTMDKLGPICRSVEDCAAVFQAIHGPDGRDTTVVDAPFRWDPGMEVKRLRVGYLKSIFEEKPQEGREEWHALDLAALEALRKLGIELRPVTLPKLPIDAMRVILTAEAAAASMTSPAAARTTSSSARSSRPGRTPSARGR